MLLLLFKYKPRVLYKNNQYLLLFFFLTNEKILFQIKDTIDGPVRTTS